MFPEFKAPPDVEQPESQPDTQPSDRVHRPALLNEAARILTDSLLHQAKGARKAQDVTQVELALRIGSSQRSVSQLENGAQMPMLDTYVAHILALGGEIAVVFPNSDPVE